MSLSVFLPWKMWSAFESFWISGCCLTPLKIWLCETSARTVRLGAQESMSVKTTVTDSSLTFRWPLTKWKENSFVHRTSNENQTVESSGLSTVKLVFSGKRKVWRVVTFSDLLVSMETIRLVPRLLFAAFGLLVSHVSIILNIFFTTCTLHVKQPSPLHLIPKWPPF